MVDTNPVSVPLTIYLLRTSQVSNFEATFLGPTSGALDLAPPLDGAFVPLPSTPNEPLWLPVVRSVLQGPSSLTLEAQSPAGLLLIRNGAHTFVITFGHAWQKLKTEWIESDFGRRVALNSIPRNRLVEIHTEQVFAKWHLSNERAPRASSIDEFGVEFDRDLVASLEGEPSGSELGRMLRGGTSVHVQIPISKLSDVLDKAATLFASEAYKKIWPEIDNVTPVQDDFLLTVLEGQIDRDLQSGQADKKIVMFTPARKREEGMQVESYVFGRLTKKSATRPYLAVSFWLNFLQEKGMAPSVKSAKASPVHLLNDSKEELHTVTAFDCFGYEVSLNGKQYVLSSGSWYEVVYDFLARVNRTVSHINKPIINLPKWDGVESEGDYNKRCAKDIGALHFDAKNISFGEGQSKFEFCDLLHLKTKTLFFAKIASKSSGMSHLVEQVRRTAELFFSVDDGYRKRLMKVFKKYHSQVDVEWLYSRPRHGDWRLCLVSLGRPAAQLPLFARSGLAKVYRNLREQGHEVEFVSV